MLTRPVKDIDALNALLAEVRALRDDVEKKGAALRKEWGVPAEKADPRAENLSHYVALRGHDLTGLQLQLAARGLSSLGRSEAGVIVSLDALIVTLRRLTGEADVPYPAAALARIGGSELEAEAERIFGKRKKGAPRVRVMATLTPEAATNRRKPDSCAATA
jgi:pyruvate kinase